MKLFKRTPASVAAVKRKYATARPVLVTLLKSQADLLDRAIDGSTNYTEQDLAAVLVAASNFYQFLKLRGAPNGELLGLLGYVSPVSSRPTCFGKSCQHFYDLITASDGSPMQAVHYTSLRNLLLYLLVRIETL